ncbi:uncharacterized protein LOC119737077 [Patiria miniata]|uniref:Uncharacterized protein n=1 Tax=Patiria miniata TaxID=46514 RepID=A0A914ATU0_PATMI|nr:uncharacterized protein LOC119737077 [Patiria miniata]
MNAHSVTALAIIIMTIGIDADVKHCFCDLRWSTTQLVSGDSVDSLPVLQDLWNPPYRHFIHVGCSRVLEHCPDDCLATAHAWLGGATMTYKSGPDACISAATNAPPGSPIYVYASYDPSVCGDRSWQYIGPLCCWEISFPGYESFFLYNHVCNESCPPNNPSC